MPTIDISLSDLESLVGRPLPRDLEGLNELLSLIKGQAVPIEPPIIENLKIELKDGNRPDLWNVEGIARGLRGFLGTKRAQKYVIVSSSGVTVNVDRRLESIRPFICCSVVKGIKLTDSTIRGIMQLQDKLDETYGRRRRRTSIGLYDYGLIKPPLTYGVSKPDEFSFVPLGFREKLTLSQILEQHPKGREYGEIVRSYRVWPLLYDSSSNVLSLPPIINSNDLGRISEDTRDVLVEVTGTSHETVSDALNIVTLSLADRGGAINSVVVRYPYGDKRRVTTPIMRPGRIDVAMRDINATLGLSLSAPKVAGLLRRAGFGILAMDGSSLKVEVPFYRIDIMHAVDVIEDIAIAYGVNAMRPRWPSLVTIGAINPSEKFRDTVRELMIGFGFQETLTYILTNEGEQFSRMGLESQDVVRLANPRIATYNCLRRWLLPSLMGILSQNTHVTYPQKVFEVGYCVLLDRGELNRTRDVLKLACVMIGPEAGFTEAKSTLESLLINMAKPHDLEEVGHPSFIEGRCGKVLSEGKEMGIIGEFHPRVLEAFGLSEPAAAFELELWEKLIG